MPRKPRKRSYNGVYHVMLRGINKQTIFEDDVDKKKFLEIVKKYKQVCGFELYAYCLMDNHVHLLLMEKEETVSQVMKRISSSFVYWYNMKYERIGHLFQERFRSENVEDIRYFKTVLRYIHQNPLNAGVVSNVWNSEWTSIHEYLHRWVMVDVDRGLNLFSHERETAIRAYIDYMKETNDDECLEYVDRVRVPDEEVRKYLKSIGITSATMIQRMPKNERDALLALLKERKGLSVSQISRIVGVSRSVVGRAQ
ncbi:transposase [Pontibacillus yanchengensis]|uniref:Transposase n=1 Tax=Pontibacillus yanchengensis Y32 TaxID=1385514 RepID=A0A0A2TFG7_9BACI|nr:transposase [Pontibacillus yanchengensis]KGP74592.1 transposase [Pontibacillus yanchengensis Y32]